MPKLPLKLEKSLQTRKQENAFRRLGPQISGTDFSSNDYLGLASNKEIFESALELLKEQELCRNGAGGSRLLSGNHKLYDLAESFIAEFHQAESALIFNSGYDANVGFFSAVPKRGDLIFFDELVHASIREGIGLSHARSFKFWHNDIEDLQAKFAKQKQNFPEADIYIITESVFSMDGDSPDLVKFAEFFSENDAFLIIDEAHATGVFGENGEGLVQKLGIQEQVFARIHTFGKGLGCQGAAILGSCILRDFLINFSRSFIYTTALPPHTVATILASYRYLNASGGKERQERLQQNIVFFKTEVEKANLKHHFIFSNSAIHCCIIPGNDCVKEIARIMKERHFDVRPILSPTVSKGEERLRFCLHSYNSEAEISEVLKVLGKFVQPE